MLGTFARALAVRKIMVGYEDLVAEAVGEVEKAGDGVLVLTRIFITYKLKVDEDVREVVARVNETHGAACPVHRSIQGAIDVSTTVEYVGEAG